MIRYITLKNTRGGLRGQEPQISQKRGCTCIPPPFGHNRWILILYSKGFIMFIYKLHTQYIFKGFHHLLCTYIHSGVYIQQNNGNYFWNNGEKKDLRIFFPNFLINIEINSALRANRQFQVRSRVLCCCQILSMHQIDQFRDKISKTFLSRGVSKFAR